MDNHSPTLMDQNIFLRDIRIQHDPGSGDQFPFSVPSISKIDHMSFKAPVTFVVGENGSGKSTLLEAIALCMGFNAEGGSRHYHFKTRETHSGLHRFMKTTRSWRKMRDGFFFRAESYYNLASNVDELDEEEMNDPLIRDAYGGKSLHAQSHGESFMALLANRFRGDGLYILDEPEAALSPSRQLSALCQFHDLVENGSQFIIATHSPILMAYPGAVILKMDRNGLTEIPYTETEHYQVTRYFLNNTEKMLKELL